MRKSPIDNDLRAGRVLITLPDINRFFEYVNKTETCWEWLGYLDGRGYARLSIGRTATLGHVLSYLLHNGPIPSGLHVCHSCDNPKCVNPNHLWLGTHQQNMEDRNKKGRCGNSGRHGEDVPTAKLSNEDVEEIRRCVKVGATQISMARRFKVTRGTINSLIKGRTWKQTL